MASRLNLQKATEYVLLQSLQTVYGRITLSLFQSLLWVIVGFLFVATLPWSGLIGVEGKELAQQLPNLFMGFLLGALPVGALLLGPLSCSLVSFSRQMEDTSNISLLWQGFRRHYSLAVRVYALYYFLVFFLVIDLIAIVTQPNRLFTVIGVVIAYSLALLLFMGLYIPGLIVFQGNTVIKVFKKALLLTMDNPLLTMIVGIILMVPALLLTWSVWTTVSAEGLLGIIGRIVMLVSLPFSIGFYGSLIHYVMDRLYHVVIARYDD